MPRTARDQSATGIYHVMIRGINRQDIFEDPEDNRKFIETLASLREVVAEDFQTKICTCHIYAYCIMPNHVHILIHEKGWTISQCVK
ncbi:MAG: transposase [Prevotella sp.]|nr:transposase [Prevotella sp.]